MSSEEETESFNVCPRDEHSVGRDGEPRVWTEVLKQSQHFECTIP